MSDGTDRAVVVSECGEDEVDTTSAARAELGCA